MKAMPAPTNYVLGPTGTPFVPGAKSGVFEKDVLVEGMYQHPIQPWETPLVVNEAYIKAVCAATNAAQADGQNVTIPDGHSNKAKDNTGFSQTLFPRFSDGKWRAVSRMEITDPAYLPKMGTTIRDVSPMIVSHPLGNGKSYGDRIAHIALVPDPVMPGQGNFVACSLGSGTLETVELPVLRPVPPSGVVNMPAKIKVTDENVKVLSLAGLTGTVGTEVEVTAESLEKALALSTSAASDVAAAQKVAKDAQDALAAEKALPVAKRLSVDAKATPYFVEAYKAKAKTLSTTLDAAQKRGAINKPMRDALEKLLSVQHGFALSVDGVAEAVDVAAVVETVVAAIPDAAVVPVGTLPAGTQASGGKPANEPPVFDAAAQADRALILAGFKSAPK